MYLSNTKCICGESTLEEIHLTSRGRPTRKGRGDIMINDNIMIIQRLYNNYNDSTYKGLKKTMNLQEKSTLYFDVVM